MYNKKSKGSAILTVIAAVLVIGLMILLPFLLYNTQLEGLDVLAIILSLLYGFLPMYLSGVSYVIVGLIFGSKMLKQQLRKKLISFNVRMLITTCVLLPFLALGVGMFWALITQSSLGLFPIIYTIITVLAYFASLIAQIVAIVVLKKSPEETEPIATAQ